MSGRTTRLPDSLGDGVRGPLTVQKRAPYDRIAEAWARHRTRLGEREQALLGRFVELLPVEGHVLDLGCGHGRPIMRALLDAGFRVTGVDLSVSQLARARRFCPSAGLIAADLDALPIVAAFDGAIVWDSLFHLPRIEHAAFFETLYGRLRSGAPALVSLGGSADEFTAPMFEHEFFYSGFAPGESMHLVRSAGFEILHEHLHRDLDDVDDRGHLALLCRKLVGEPA